MRLWAGLLVAIVLGSGLAVAEPVPCPDSKAPPLALARVRDLIARNKEVTIVALGSSSTEGVQASDVGHSYPAMLQAELAAALPQAHIAVLNRGIGGEDVVEMLPRMERDAMAPRPALVIWQVGANGAMRKTDPDVFKRLVSNGVQRMLNARLDVVLMDNQRAPAILASPDHIRIDQALADVAVSSGAKLFSRGALMDQWRQDGFPYESFVSGDSVHMNDRGYRCLAKALAASIVEGIGKPQPMSVMRNAVASKH